MNITPHRALCLAVASVEDCARIVPTCDSLHDRDALFRELLDTRDYLASLRDKESPDRPTSGYHAPDHAGGEPTIVVTPPALPSAQ